MKVTGIIAEYNPFHNGHKYQIQKAKELTNADFIIVVMSGNFTQRGTPALMDKFSRSKMALYGGADLVLELPVCYATASAEYFATGAVALLDALGIVDCICFGSECGNIEELNSVAHTLLNETNEYKLCLKQYLKNGNTYPVARKMALQNTMDGFSEYENIMTYPNNILGIEYLKALMKLDSSIQPFTNKRIGSDYHSYKLSNYSFSSAISIRQSLMEQANLPLIKEQVPIETYQIMEDTFIKGMPIFANDFSTLLKYKLLQEKEQDFTKYLDITNDISDRIAKQLLQMQTFDQFCNLLKTKEVTYARISRCLNHILLDITKDDLELYKKNQYVYYARVLGIRTDITPFTKALKSNTKIPLISKTSDALQSLFPIGKQQLQHDIYAAHIYETIVSNKFNTPAFDEYRRQIVKAEK